MPLRIGILDIAATLVLLVVILLPGRASRVDNAYPPDDALRDIALHQARLTADPGDAEAASRLAELLTAKGQTDWAVQVAGEAAQHSEAASWRALLAISMAHAERIEVLPAFEFAQKALEACVLLGIGPDRCPAPEHIRLSVYTNQLEVGVRSGINPRVDPKGFQEAILRSVRMVRFRGATPSQDSQDEPEDQKKNDTKGDKLDEQKSEDDRRP